MDSHPCIACTCNFDTPQGGAAPRRGGEEHQARGAAGPRVPAAHRSISARRWKGGDELRENGVFPKARFAVHWLRSERATGHGGPVCGPVFGRGPVVLPGFWVVARWVFVGVPDSTGPRGPVPGPSVGRVARCLGRSERYCGKVRGGALEVRCLPVLLLSACAPCAPCAPCASLCSLCLLEVVLLVLVCLVAHLELFKFCLLYTSPSPRD